MKVPLTQTLVEPHGERSRDHPTVVRTETFGRLGYGTHFRLTKPTDIDRSLEALMREAYALHAGTHDRQVPPIRLSSFVSKEGRDWA